MINDTKSPITDKLLRQPGQSLDEAIQKIFDDKVMPYILFSFFVLFATLIETYRWFTATPPQPFLFAVVTLIAIIISIYKVLPIRKQIRAMRQGSEGEKAVAELLSQFREAKMRVFHDIQGDNFNLDHVVVSTKGIFLIETKTYSKPEKGKAEIFFNGKTISKNGHDIGNSIIIQVKAASRWLSNLVEELTAKKYEVQPTVVFPGWYVKMVDAHQSNIWVVNPKNLAAFINKKSEVLSIEEVKLISNHLVRFIRSK